MCSSDLDERHVRRAAWAFPAYLLAINVFVLPIAVAGGVLGRPDAETFVLSLPLEGGAPGLALVALLARQQRARLLRVLSGLEPAGGNGALYRFNPALDAPTEEADETREEGDASASRG